MVAFIEYIDRLSGAAAEVGLAEMLDRVSFVFLTITILAAPHSIAATQVAWGIGLFALIIRSVMRPRKIGKWRPLVIALWVFFGWSVVSAVFSYEPAVSLDRLRGPGLILFCIFVIGVIRNIQSAYFLAFALIVSCMVNVIMTPIQRIIGRGVEIHGVAPDGPLAKSGLGNGDTILKADGKKLSDPQALIDAIESKGSSKVDFHRSDWYSSTEVYKKDLLPGSDANFRLGVSTSGPSHYWRMMGFYNHYTTYAEVLQLIMSLLFGLMVAAILKRRKGTRPTNSEPQTPISRISSLFTSTPFLIASFAAMSVAMIMTVTRASQLSLMISALSIGMISMSRRALIIAVLVAIPVGAAGLYLLQESRKVGVFDSTDESSQYRLMMWRDGIRLWQASPRNAVFGVGMDSIQKHWQEWDMFDKGWQHMGHFHSTPVQLLAERGLPALILWLIVLGIYARSLWKGIRANRDGDWRTFGILAGCFGGAVGFFSSGLVHWNLGDAEVAMVFFLLMGIGIRTVELSVGESRIITS